MKRVTTHVEQPRRMKKLLAMALIVSICCGYCGRALAQGDDGAWKTYLDAAAKAQEGKNYEEAENLYRLAESKAKEFGETDERYVHTLAQQLKLYLIEKKKEGAEAPYRQLLSSLGKGAAADSTTYAWELYGLGGLYGKEKMFSEAEPLFKYALAIYRRGMRPGDSKVSEYLYALATNYYSQNNSKAAEETFKEELEIIERDPLLSKQMIASYTLGMLGLITRAAKRYEESERYMRRALEVVTNLRGENHPETASLLEALYLVLLPQEKYEESERCIRRALQITENVYGKESPQVVTVLNFMASQFTKQARGGEAVAVLSRALDILDKLPNAQAGDITNIADALFTVHNTGHNYVEGEALCKRERDMLERKGLNNAETDLMVTDCFTVFYYKSGNYVAEAETLRRFVASQEKLGAAGGGALVDKLMALGNSLIRQKKYDEALPALRRAEQILNKTPEKPNVGVLYSLARYHYFTGDYAQSEAYFTKTLALAEKDKDATGALNLAWYRKGYALLLYAQGKTAQAEEVFNTSVATLKTDQVDGERDVATSYHELAELLRSQRKYAEAEPLYRRAIEGREKALGAWHPELAASLEGYAALLRGGGRAAEAEPLESRARAIRAKQPAR